MGIAVKTSPVRASTTGGYSFVDISGKLEGAALQEATVKINHPWRQGGFDLRFSEMTPGVSPMVSLRPSNVAPGPSNLAILTGSPADESGNAVVIGAATQNIEENGSLVMPPGEYILAISASADGPGQVTGYAVFSP